MGARTVTRAGRRRVAAPGRRTTRGHDLPLIGAVLVVTVALVAPWLVHIPWERGVLCVVNLALCIAGFVRGWRPVVRPAQLICFGFLLPYLGIAPIYQMGTHSAAWSDSGLMTNAHDGDLFRALLILTLGNAALLWGTSRVPRTPAPDRTPAPRVVPRTGLPWLFLAAAAVLLPRSISIVGGFGNLFVNRYDAAARLAAQGVTLDQAGGAEVALVNLVPASLALAAAYLFLMRALPVLRARGLSRVNGLDLAGLLVATALALVFANPLANSRFTFIYVAGALAMFVLRPVSRRAGACLAAITLLVTLVAYPLANFFRTDMELTAGVAAFATPDFDGFQQVVNSGPYTDAMGHSSGQFLLSAVGYFVPRSIWGDKSYPASEAVAAYRGYSFTNLSLPIHAELYIEFGYVGVALLMFALGWFLARVDWAWVHAPGTRLGVVAPLVALAMLGLIRGPLGANIPIYGTALALVVLALRVPGASWLPGARRRGSDVRRERDLVLDRPS